VLFREVSMEEEFIVTGRCGQWIALCLTGDPFQYVSEHQLSRHYRWQLVSHGAQSWAPCSVQCLLLLSINWYPAMEFTAMNVLTILNCLPRCQYQRQQLLAYCTNVWKGCNWFWNSGLLLDPSKSAMAYLGTRNRLRNSTLPSQITRAGCTVDVSECVYWVVCIQCKSVQHTFIGPSCKQCC